MVERVEDIDEVEAVGKDCAGVALLDPQLPEGRTLPSVDGIENGDTGPERVRVAPVEFRLVWVAIVVGSSVCSLAGCLSLMAALRR